MNRCLILFSIVFGLVILHSYASNLPTCKGNYWTNCFGTDTYTNGDKYLGEFKDNKRNGHGTYTYANGDKYVGEYKDNLKHGQGTFTFADGDKFFGGYKDGKYDGFGTYIFADGSRDVGQWENGKLNGSAIQYNADGSIYRQGIYKDDEFQYAKKIESKKPMSNLPACKGSYNPNTWTNCFGTYIGGNSQGKWAGDKYVGEFVDGSFNGKGTYYFLGDHEFKGDIYIGEFKDNMKHGQGTYTFADGDKYIGEHKDNLKHGQGTYTFADGAKYVGEFRDGKYNGHGSYTYANGNKYVGEFKDAKYNGQGTFYYLSDNEYKGDIFVGEYKDNKRNGHGTYTFADGAKFVGEYKDDKVNGEGIEYNADGSVYRQGVYKDWEFQYAKKIEPKNSVLNLPDCQSFSHASTIDEPFNKGWHNCKGKVHILEGEFKGWKYFGEFKNGEANGYGESSFANGDKYVGEFRDGEYNGQGIFTFSNGDKYVGEFKDSLRNGQGTYTYATGKIEEGIWKDDEFLYAKKIEPATQINIPDNAYASGNSWKCNSGYFKYGEACFKIPENAYASGNSWKCKSGFDQSGNTCKKKPESKIEVQPEEVLQAASGTGFIISEAGHIVTNHHVIEGCTEVKVHKDGKVYKGNVIANDIMNDLALIKSNYKPNVIFPLSDKNPSLLQDIYVAGFPFGNAISSSVKVTKGVVSSETGIGNNYSNMQIDAAIQPGNSGGPILDDYGNVIGVAVAKLAMEKIYEDFGVFPENTNFGIKSSVVENLIQAHNVNNPPPNTEEINKSDLGYNIKQATLYLSCWMTLAQIKKFSTKKVIFRDLVN